MRVIVTGSRHWTDEDAIREALVSFPPDAVIVHGAQYGADLLADSVARAMGLRVEPHPADWRRWGLSAGPRRNTEMVAAGADLVLAFPLPGSVGTWDCVRKARAAGIEVRVRAVRGARR